MTGKFPNTVINRLTLYHCILVDYIKNDLDTITSSAIAALLKIDDSQVRKDISLLKNTGKSRVGYLVSDLKNSIEKPRLKTEKRLHCGCREFGNGACKL